MRRTTFLVVLPIAVAFLAGYSVRKPSKATSATRETFLASVSHEERGESRRNAIVVATQKVSPAADEAGEGKLSLLVDRKGTKLYLSYTSIW